VKRVLLIVLMVLAGIGLFAYPAISNYIFSRNCSTAVQSYDDSIAKADAAALEQALLEAVTYNENLEGNPVHDPCLKGSGMVMADNYFEVLNLGGDGVMGYIDIPKIAVRIPIYHGTAEAVLLKGVGHLEGSSMPVGGIGNHSVLTGHTGLANAKMFTDRVKRGEGDEFYVHILDQVLAYKVNQVKVVLPEVTGDLRRAQGEDYCSLVTCTPYGINSHRLQVRGARTEYTPENAKPAPSAALLPRLKDWDMLIGLAAGFALLLTGIIVFLLIRRRKTQTEGKAAASGAPVERSDNPWKTPAAPTQTPGGRKASRRRRPRRGKKGEKYWWEANRG
jgi:sortase A